MDCTLMHKNIPVVDMNVDERGRIARLSNLQNANHLPLGVESKDGVNRNLMDDWWTGRAIPASRDGIWSALDILKVSDTLALIDKCYGLSLSDQYWICPKDSGLLWKDINFFQNDFSKDVGEILFGHEPAELDRVSLLSPDNTSDGWLRKKWIIAEGKRFLIKGGSGDYQQEPFNEVIACAVMRRLGIAHVDYTLTFDGGRPYSACENFITPDTELIPAWRVKESFKRDNRDSSLTHLLKCCDNLGIAGVKPALDKMLILDYIISNEDRHYNNFGFVRNAETLEWLGLAPVYDSGTSLWYNTQRVGADRDCKPFRSKHTEQIKLVEDLAWFDAAALKGLDSEIMDILSKSEDVDENRRTRIASAVMERCGQIEKLAHEKPSTLDWMRERQKEIAQTPRRVSGKKQEPEIE